MGKKFMTQVQVLHCIACHSVNNPLVKIGGLVDARICKSCVKKIKDGEVITEPQKRYTVSFKNNYVNIEEIKVAGATTEVAKEATEVQKDG